MELLPIRKEDNADIARVIRAVLEEFGLNKAGTVYTDASTDNLFELFEHEAKSSYWVVKVADEIVGGAGIFPTEGLDINCVELVKLYIVKKYRGKGLGEKLIRLCLVQAKNLGFEKVYLETLPELSSAVGLYEKLGFVKINQSLGNSGHFSCDLWMIKEI